MPKPSLPFLDLLEKRQEGLVNPSFFSFNARISLYRKVNLIQECYISPSPCKGCSMKVSSDSFILAPYRASKLLFFKCGNKNKSYKLKASVTIPPSHDNGESNFTIKYIDFQPHAFTATICDKKLHYGDPETFKIIEQITHPDKISQHCISTLCPFNTIAAGNKGQVYVSDFRTGSVVMTFSGPKVRSSGPNSDHCVSWSPFSDRVVCSLYSSEIHSDDFPLSIFDLRKPQCGIGPKFKCDFSKMDNDHVEYVVPFVNFLESGDGSLVVSIVNDSHVRIWDIVSGELKQTIYRQIGTAKADHCQPAFLSLGLDSMIFIPDNTGIKVYSSSKFYYTIKVADCVDVSVLGYNQMFDDIIGLSSCSFKSFYIWECGR